MTEVSAKRESEVTEENQFLVSMIGLASGDYETEDDTYTVDVSSTGNYIKVLFRDEEGDKVEEPVVFEIDDLCYAAAEELDL